MRDRTPFTLAAVRGIPGALLLSLAMRGLGACPPGQTPGARLELAFLALGERPSPRLFGAAALIFTGVAFAIWPSRTGRPAT